MRNSRIRSTAIAATALLAALSLTACGSDEDVKTSGVAASSPIAPATSVPAGEQSSPAATDQTEQPASSGGNAKTGSSGTSGGNGGTSTSGGSSGSSTSGGSAKNSGGGAKADTGPVTTTCTGGNTTVKVTQVNRPINHLLLTVTNTGSKACNAYHAPFVGFDNAQSATHILEDSKPQAVVTLSPGQSAYAAIGLSAADGGNVRTAKRLTVHFAPASNSGSTGPGAGLALPAGTTIDDKAFVTYWQSDMSDALTY
ncbi:DUF4232 domain-containing protein [Streptomyces sp. NPDC052236]|uniref:DUF4232 domain-containing protein n=1 Tax=Streptomyces sp. NPDC052236 TaxID=3365686 RepID=UPI0037D7CE93